MTQLKHKIIFLRQAENSMLKEVFTAKINRTGMPLYGTIDDNQTRFRPHVTTLPLHLRVFTHFHDMAHPEPDRSYGLSTTCFA